MPASRLRPASRALVLWFASTTLLPTIALVWLGVIVVNRDATLEGQRQQADRERAADTGVAALTRTLSEFEEALGSVSATPSAPIGPAGDRAAFVIFDAGGAVARAGIRLPYYPAVSRRTHELPAQFEEADALEFVRRDLSATIRMLEPLVNFDAPYVRAEAWMRIGRAHRKAGDRTRALDAFDRLALLEEVPAQGAPSGLQGRTARALIFASDGSNIELKREATLLERDLQTGRWTLTDSQYEYAMRQVSEWLGKATERSLAADETALVEATAALWHDWRKAAGDVRTGRRTFGTGQRSVLVLTQATPHRLAAGLVSASSLRSAWTEHLKTLGAPLEMDFALADVDGHAVVGDPGTAPDRQIVRTHATTKLPWTMYATARDASSPRALSNNARLLLAGIGLMIAVVLASGYAINRAVSREMRVARLQSDFVAAVSHEFRSPLATIRQLSELLSSARVSTPERRQQFYETILAESERMNRLVENLLDFGRLDAGRLEYRREPVDVNALVGDVAKDIQRDAAAGGYGIELDKDARLPPVLGDRDALAHVFRNLLDNAVKYSPDCRTVWISVRGEEGQVAVTVRDRGLGIPASEQRDIFQKFVRGAEATAARIKGTGIGLAMARQIVEAHGGTIAVESQPGHGSTFTVTLPVGAERT